jgi:hypothetical protein
MVPAQQAVQPPRALGTGLGSKSHDLAREAVGWNGLLGRYSAFYSVAYTVADQR